MSRRILIAVFITSSLTLFVGKSQACNLPPIPDINNPYYQDICVGCKAYFDGSTSYDQDEDGNSVETYYWKYFGGDSWHNGGAEPNHTYNTAGVYYVSLRVRDDEDTNSLPENDDSCWVYVYQVTKVEAGGKQTGQNLYLANDYLDEPDKRQVLYQWVQATLYPNVVTPDTFYWTPGPSAPTLPRIDPDEWRSSGFYAKDHAVYNIAAHCCVSVKDMNIVIEGVDIKTANITDPCEMSETYNIFLNENFDQQVEAPTEPGHTQCYYVDYNDNSLAGDANDELGGISFNAQTYGDAGARVTFQGYGIKLYDSDKNVLEFDNNYDGEPNYSPIAIGNTLYVEGIVPGISTLTVILKTQDAFIASDQLLIKVIPLNLIATDPPVESAHEICYGDVLFIPVNDNDSDGDRILDFIDNYIPGGDPDLKAIALVRPTGAVNSDISGYITVTLPLGVWGYQNKDKTGWKATTSKSFSLSDLGVVGILIYLEGRSHRNVLDAKVKVSMTLDSGVKCRDEIRYTVLRVGLLATDLYGTVSSVYEENPGAFLHFNVDNDNNSINSIPSSKHPGADYNETTNSVTNEDDLKSLTMSLLPSLDFGSMVLTIPGSSKIWKSATKGSSNLVVDTGGSKTWDLSVPNQRSDFLSRSSLYVEGVNTGSGNIVLKYVNPPGFDIHSDIVKYTFIAADCGDQPRTEAEDVYAWSFDYQVWVLISGHKHRDWLEGEHNALIRCEYSATQNIAARPWSGGKRCTIPEYNCIAYSVDETNSWYEDSYIAHNYGDKDDNFELTDMDDFYYKKKGWTLITSGTDEEKADQAEAMYYSNYHAARKKPCGCGTGKWIMYESKLGQWERIEHVWEQLNDSRYGTPIRFYK